MIREYSPHDIDIICDFCTSKLSDFVDNQQLTITMAYKLAEKFGWNIKNGWENVLPAKTKKRIQPQSR